MTDAVTAREADAALGRMLQRPAPDDPFPYYDAIRRAGTIRRSAYGLWVLSGHAEVTAAARHPGLGHAVERTRQRKDWREHESLRQLFTALVALNPPDHTRLRRLVGRAFTPATVARLRPAIEELAGRMLDELADRASGGHPVDIMEAVAFPLPVTVIGELLGVPTEDAKMFRQLVADWTLVTDEGFSEQELRQADAATTTMRAYFTDLLRERRAHPKEDLLSALAQVEAEGERLHEDELLTMAAFLFIAGFETTTNLIGSGLMALLNHPDQLRAWRHNPGLTATAVEELLRFDPPLHTVGRAAHRDVEIGGHRVRAGEVVLLMLAAANRDPAKFAVPDRLDLAQDSRQHLSFSAGVHYCLGAGLARLEAEIFFPLLLQKFPAIELGGAPVRRASLAIYGYEEVPLLLRAA
ncbi:cytochrome P450 [Streptomyces sp. NPDC102405]|uniref:cytochrome P450 n=1 Tax=Streptomyces sp. NPDC102405 TaxID=3366170 RepID=UPI00381165B2